MLYTETDSFFLQFNVEDLPNEINSRRALREAFNFSDVSDHYLTGLYSIANAGEVGLFKDECKCHPIVKFVGLQPKMHSFTVMDAEEYDPRLPVKLVKLRYKAVAEGVSRANIKRYTHDDCVTMFREGDARKVTNRRIGSKLHQINYGNWVTVNYWDDDIFHNIEQSCRYTRWSKRSAASDSMTTSATC